MAILKSRLQSFGWLTAEIPVHSIGTFASGVQMPPRTDRVRVSGCAGGQIGRVKSGTE